MLDNIDKRALAAAKNDDYFTVVKIINEILQYPGKEWVARYIISLTLTYKNESNKKTKTST